MTDTGDTSPGSGLAFDRFAAANAFGVLRYERTIKIPRNVARDIAGKPVVIHGEDLDENGPRGRARPVRLPDQPPGDQRRTSRPRLMSPT